MSVVISDEIFSPEKLSKFYDIISFLYGPNTNHYVVRSVKIFSSNQLFESLNSKCEVIQMMQNFFKNQWMLYKDGGLFVALATVNLIRHFQLLDVPLYNIVQANQFTLIKIKEACNRLAIKFDIGKFQDVSIVIRSIVSSKLSVSSKVMQDISLLFARAFTTHDPLRNINVIVNEGETIENSELHEGLLVRLDRFSRLNKLKKKNNLRVIVFSVSLALDSEEMISDMQGIITVDSIDNFKTDVVLKELYTYCKSLVPYVDMVLCQKVVHPRLKRMFEKNDVLCIDRIGESLISRVEQVCECKKVCTILEKDFHQHLGKISKCELVTFGGKSYLKLHSENLKTMILCGYCEIEAKTLHYCFETCMIALKTLAVNGFVVSGGGCMETELAIEMISQIHSETKNEINKCHKYLQEVVNSLLNTAVAISNDCILQHSVDKTFFHHWINADTSQHCCCGVVQKHRDLQFVDFLEVQAELARQEYCSVVSRKRKPGRPSVVWVKDIYLHNLQSSFQLANLVLNIGVKVLPI